MQKTTLSVKEALMLKIPNRLPIQSLHLLSSTASTIGTLTHTIRTLTANNICNINYASRQLDVPG